MLNVRAALKDVLAGVAFIGLGLAFAVGSTAYDIGTPLRMGPGYFPLVLGGLLAILGVVTVVKGLIAGEAGEIGAIPWRAVVLITVAVVFFGLTARGLGLVPSLLVTTILVGFAGERAGVLPPVLIAVGLTIVSILIFVVGLQLRLPLIGPWIPI
jgi:Tripartite tricarboxylate transporter TctB family